MCIGRRQDRSSEIGVYRSSTGQVLRDWCVCRPHPELGVYRSATRLVPRAWCVGCGQVPQNLACLQGCVLCVVWPNLQTKSPMLSVDVDRVSDAPRRIHNVLSPEDPFSPVTR